MTGVDLLDIVMGVERAFHISLWSPDAQAIATVGQLYDRIVERVEEKRRAPSLESYLFGRIRDALQDGGVAAGGEIRRSTPLADVIPRNRRRSAWVLLRYRTGEGLPPLRRPWPVRTVLTVAALVLGWLCTFGLMLDFHPEQMISRPLATLGCLFFFVPAAALVALIGIWLTGPWAVVLPRGVSTVDDLSRAVVARNYDSAEETASRRPEEIWALLREIILDVLPVDPSKITREARFVEDLHAG